MPCKYNVTMWHASVTIVAVDK